MIRRLLTLSLLALLCGCRHAQPTPSAKPAGEPGKPAAKAAKTAPVTPPITLKPGDRAPKLTVGRWLKGGPVDGFAAGKFGVVVCFTSGLKSSEMVLTHLADTQKRYPQTTIVAVSVLESQGSGVEAFVKSLGDKVGVPVAVDKVADGTPSEQGAVAKEWLQAAGQRNVPTALVVDAKGLLAWAGAAQTLDSMLPRITSGKWDAVAEAKALEAKVAKARGEAEVQQKRIKAELDKVKAAGKDPAARIAAYQDWFKRQPADEKRYAAMLVQTMVQAKQGQQAAEYVQRVFEGQLKDDPHGLCQLSRALVGPRFAKDTADPALVALALKATQHADELLKSQDWLVADTLATVQWRGGHKAEAIAAAERALSLGGKETKRVEMLTKRIAELKNGGPLKPPATEKGAPAKTPGKTK